MASRPLIEAALDAAAHLCALTALALAGRSARVAHGWMHVPVTARFTSAPSLSIVVPARNEERSIERCVRSLLTQTLDDVEVIAVNDRSDDATGEILERLARENSRLRVVHGADLPPGWIGKPWALEQGIRVARGAWLLFTDADTAHAPESASSALAFALARNVDALTLATYQELRTLAERAVLPTVLGLVLLASGAPAVLNDPAVPDCALANGQYILVRRAAYDALGGHAALRGEIVEDLAFARLLKADGRFRLLLAGGEQQARVRMYTSFGEIWEGFTKNMYAGADGDLGALVGGALFLALLSVVPSAIAVDALLRRRTLRAAEALACLAAGIGVQAWGLPLTGLPRRLAFFAPAGYAVCGAIVVNSTTRVLLGRGVSWRGRRYSGRVPSRSAP